MLDKAYYYKLYEQKKKEVESYEKNLEDLNKAYNNLTNKMEDEISAVNSEFEDLKEDLKKSVRHNTKFSSNVNAVTNNKEKVVTADSFLNVAVSNLEDEIYHIDMLKKEAIDDRNEYYGKYKEAE